MRALILSIALIITCAAPVLAVDVLIVQSGNGAAYAESIKGFKETYKGSTQTILLSDYAEVDLIRLVKEEQPLLVLAVGDPALAKAKKIRQVPVVALMALSFNLSGTRVPNIHGVPVLHSPDAYMQLFTGMGIKRVGVVYDPDRTGGYLKRAQQLAGKLGIRLVARKVNSTREVVGAIDLMAGDIDLIWMLPDSGVVTASTLESFFAFSAKNSVPVVTFSRQYLPKGAAVAMETDRSDMGRQAGLLASKLLRHDSEAVALSTDPRKLNMDSNENIVRKLNLKIPSNPFTLK